MKQLTEMSDEELGTLFPIILTEHKKDWAKLYDQEERILYDTIGKNIYRIDHIGSTAVEQLIAKPTIDILLEHQRINQKSGEHRLYLFSTASKTCPAHDVHERIYPTGVSGTGLSYPRKICRTLG